MARITSLKDAVQEFVHDGDIVALEGFTHLIPFAAGHEIIRQRRRNLTLVRLTPDVIYDQLIGAGCASTLVFSWGGNPGVGSLHRLRDAVENGWPAPLAIDEHAHAGMAAAYAAGASGLPMARLRLLALLAASLATGAAVAVAGVIGFVGLAAPHLVRAAVRGDPARLLLPSALAGGLMLVLADLLARMTPTDQELKLGVFTALVGAPLFALIAWRAAKEWRL